MFTYSREQWLRDKGREYEKDELRNELESQEELDENAYAAEQIKLDQEFEMKQTAQDIIEEQQQKWGEEKEESDA